MEKHHEMKEIILKIVDWIETAIAIFLMIMIVILGAKFVMELYHEGFSNYTEETINHILEASFSLIIGVEFVRMLSKHSIGSIVEILLFSIARGMIVQHNDGKETVLLVFALVLVMVIRKYLLLSCDQEGVNMGHGDEIKHYEESENQK